jgi:hypothetical protein
VRNGIEIFGEIGIRKYRIYWITILNTKRQSKKGDLKWAANLAF